MVRASAIVTGDAIGQVSSQTLQNLAVISTATDLSILRPLAATPKEEIVELARRVGTHDLSARIPEFCALTSRAPETHARPAAVAEAEAGLDLARLEAAVEERAVFDLHGLDVARIHAPDLEVEKVPEGAVVVDLRSAIAFKSWHYPEALHLDYAAALEACGSFDRRRLHLFYCEVGLKSAHLAETLHRLGGRACHFQGGLRGLLRYAERQDQALRAAISPALLSD